MAETPEGPGPDLGIYDPPPIGRKLLDAIAGGEASGYNILNGNTPFEGFADHPRRIGPGGTSRAAGRYQFIPGTWDRVRGELGLPNFAPENQDRAAWALAKQTYNRNGRDLEADLASGDPAKAQLVASVLNKEWPSLPGGDQPNPATGGFFRRLYGGAVAPGGNALVPGTVGEAVEELRRAGAPAPAGDRGPVNPLTALATGPQLTAPPVGRPQDDLVRRQAMLAIIAQAGQFKFTPVHYDPFKAFAGAPAAQPVRVTPLGSQMVPVTLVAPRTGGTPGMGFFDRGAKAAGGPGT